MSEDHQNLPVREQLREILYYVKFLWTKHDTVTPKVKEGQPNWGQFGTSSHPTSEQLRFKAPASKTSHITSLLSFVVYRRAAGLTLLIPEILDQCDIDILRDLTKL